MEVTNCFCVPHKEYEDHVEAELQYAQDMFELNKKVNQGESKDPIHLTVDTTLNSGKVNLKAYVFVPIGVPGATSGSMFTPVPVEITAYEPEVIGLDLLHKTKMTKLRQVETIPDLARISEGTTKLEVMLDAVISYVQGVLEGRETPKMNPD